MTKTRYGYVPFNRGADIKTDAIRSTLDGRCMRAGRVVVTTTGAPPRESMKEAIDGRYVRRVTVAQLLDAGFTAHHLRALREMHSATVRLENEFKFDEA